LTPLNFVAPFGTGTDASLEGGQGSLLTPLEFGNIVPWKNYIFGVLTPLCVPSIQTPLGEIPNDASEGYVAPCLKVQISIWLEVGGHEQTSTFRVNHTHLKNAISQYLHMYISFFNFAYAYHSENLKIFVNPSMNFDIFQNVDDYNFWF